MKTKISTENLKKVTKIAAIGFMSGKHVMEVKDYQKIKIASNKIIATTCDPDGISVKAEINVENNLAEDMEFLLHKNKIMGLEYLIAPETEIEFDKEQQKIYGKNGEFEFEWKTLDTNLFSELNLEKEKALLEFQISLNELKEKLIFVKPFIGNSPERPILEYVMCFTKGTDLYFQTCNGYALHLDKIPLLEKPKENLNFNIPKEFISFVEKLKGDGLANVKVTERFVICEYEMEEELRTIGMFKLFDGQTLDFSSVIEKESKYHIIVNREEFINKIKKLATFTEENLVILEIKEKKINILMKNEKYFNKEKVIFGEPINLEEEFKIGFNVEYILKALKSMKTENVVLNLSGPLDNMKILTYEETEKLYPLSLILPIRITETE